MLKLIHAYEKNQFSLDRYLVTVKVKKVSHSLVLDSETVTEKY